jgi:SAM-dependent methyltransferase
MNEQSHRSDPRILNRRTLERDHRRLADLLRLGMSVLDVGCGTGAITAGIAHKVAPEGQALGVDRDETLLAAARQEHQSVRNLIFENRDALCLPFESRFDIVTAARTLQWISQPDAAVERMKAAAKPGGCVIVLDYNHANNSWAPEPPLEFRRFYQAFLDWRTASNWDNRIADHLPDLFQSAGLKSVQTFFDDETVLRGDSEFLAAAAVWSHVIQTIGASVVAAGFLQHRDLLAAEQCYAPWTQSRLQRQSLSMRTVIGTV